VKRRGLGKERKGEITPLHCETSPRLVAPGKKRGISWGKKEKGGRATSEIFLGSSAKRFPICRSEKGLKRRKGGGEGERKK